MSAAEPERRAEYVRKISFAAVITLGIAAVAGKEILDAIGIDLGAFGIAGGLIVALMGFEMLFGAALVAVAVAVILLASATSSWPTSSTSPRRPRRPRLGPARPESEAAVRGARGQRRSSASGGPRGRSVPCRGRWRGCR